jgi:hypothetical protein
MVMNVYGTKPTGPRGEYFRNNIFKWHPLARYCQLVAPDITSACKLWHTNEGDGLDAAGAAALADALEAEINAGWAAAYGTFQISQRKGKGAEGFQEVAWLNAFAQIGLDVVPHGELSEPSDFVENVAAFIAFLRESGGFSIC